MSKNPFQRKPVKNVERFRQTVNIDFVKKRQTVRTVYFQELTLECGHVQMSNGARVPKQVTCKKCRDVGTINAETKPF